MTLPASGAISMSQINVELTRAPNAPLTLNDPMVRLLAGVSSGAISLSNLYGKNGQAFNGNLHITGNATNDPNTVWMGGIFGTLIQAANGDLSVGFDSAPNWGGNVTVTNNTTGASAVCSKSNATLWTVSGANKNIVLNRISQTDSFSVVPS
ncbi:hypothetical protein [Paraburkholderia sediminicola]|uniref:hypothetical protein n=1 Tax=Paraburkholderia sediminicola TaxID=458836 RepID=UPI0038BA2F8E